MKLWIFTLHDAKALMMMLKTHFSIRHRKGHEVKKLKNKIFFHRASGHTHTYTHAHTCSLILIRDMYTH